MGVRGGIRPHAHPFFGFLFLVGGCEGQRLNSDCYYNNLDNNSQLYGVTHRYLSPSCVNTPGFSIELIYVSIRKLLKNRILSMSGRVAYPKGAESHTRKMRPSIYFLR